eukprot:6198374-Pleurochrysis_carterae.AAC.4
MHQLGSGHCSSGTKTRLSSSLAPTASPPDYPKPPARGSIAVLISKAANSRPASQCCSHQCEGPQSSPLSPIPETIRPAYATCYAESSFVQKHERIPSHVNLATLSTCTTRPPRKLYAALRCPLGKQISQNA